MRHTLPCVLRWVVGLTAAVVLSADAVSTAPDALFTLFDPDRDDHGDGSLVYPLRHDIEQGELDLV